jgi:hypothetical protein
VNISNAFSREAKSDSSYKRIQRFLKSFFISEEMYARFVLKLLPLGQYYLTMDRTNWKFGSTDINILMIGVVHEGTAFPLFWKMLSKKGNSNTEERKEIIEKVINFLKKENIAGILADREFIGREWFSFLLKQQIPFCIRIRENFLIHGSKKRSIKDLIRGLSPGGKLIFPQAIEVCGEKLFISGAWIGAEYCVVVSNQYHDNALETYMKRWGIEVLFGCLKSRGFCFEDTHMTDPDRISKLIALLCITFTCMHCIGEWQHSINPISIKNMVERQKVFFVLGWTFSKMYFLIYRRNFAYSCTV